MRRVRDDGLGGAARARRFLGPALVAAGIVCAACVAGCGGDHDPLPSLPLPVPVSAPVPIPERATVAPDPCVPLGAPTTLGPGFVDLTAHIDLLPPFAIPQLTDLTIPGLTVGVMLDLDGSDGDGPLGVLLVSGNDLAAYRYVRDGGGGLVSVPLFSEMTIRAGGLVGVVDLDGDGRPDLIGAHGTLGAAYDGLGATQRSLPIHVYPAGAGGGPVTIADLDQDGWLDLVVSDGACCPTCRDLRPLLRRSARAYDDHSELVAAAAPTTPFSLVATPFGPGEQSFLTIGNSCVPSGAPSTTLAPGAYHVVSLGDDGYPRLAAFDPMPDRPYYMADQWAFYAQKQPYTLTAPMAGTVGDIDGDGIFDLVLSLFSHTQYRGRATWPLEDQSYRAGLASEFAGEELTVTPWGVLLLDVDQDGRPDIVTAHGNDIGGWYDPVRRRTAERTTVHWNAGDFCYSDVSALAGALPRGGQWQSLLADDLDGDGDADLIVGGQGEMPRVYRNDVATGNHGFSLRLRGTTSNHLGVGARVDVTAVQGGPTQHFIVAPSSSPGLLSMPPLFVGLGTAGAAFRVRITWPSGVVQELAGLDAGALHTVTEPALLTLDPVERELPADGASTATVTVTPRATDGSLRAGRAVTLAARFGEPLQIVPLPVRSDGAAQFRVTAPATPGSSVLEATVDGVAVPIRPRLFFTAQKM